MGSWGVPQAVQGPGDTYSSGGFGSFVAQKNTCKWRGITNSQSVNKNWLKNIFSWFQDNCNTGFLLLPPLTRSPSLKDGGFCTPKLSQINKNLQVLNRADNIRPYGASKDIAKNSKHLQALNRVEQSPPLQKNKHRKGREQLPAFPHQSIISISGLTVFKYCITRSS